MPRWKILAGWLLILPWHRLGRELPRRDSVPLWGSSRPSRTSPLISVTLGFWGGHAQLVGQGGRHFSKFENGQRVSFRGCWRSESLKALSWRLKVQASLGAELSRCAALRPEVGLVLSEPGLRRGTRWSCIYFESLIRNIVLGYDLSDRQASVSPSWDRQWLNAYMETDTSVPQHST